MQETCQDRTSFSNQAQDREGQWFKMQLKFITFHNKDVLNVIYMSNIKE